MIGAMINEIIIKHPLQDIKDFGTLPCCALGAPVTPLPLIFNFAPILAPAGP